MKLLLHADTKRNYGFINLWADLTTPSFFLHFELFYLFIIWILSKLIRYVQTISVQAFCLNHQHQQFYFSTQAESGRGKHE